MEPFKVLGLASAVLADEFKDILVALWLLVSELIAWEAEDSETSGVVAIVEFDEVGVVLVG